MRDYINLFEAKDVNGNVDISNKNLTVIPKEYGIVTGNFLCHRSKLKSLKGAPRKVGKSFYCYANQLTTLEGGPEEVNGDFYCDHSQLTTLEGAPSKIGGEFWCWGNELVSLKGVSKLIGKRFLCHENSNLAPWEMRYILFTDLRDEFKSDYKEVNNLVNEFMQLSQKEKQEQIHEYMARLKEMR